MNRFLFPVLALLALPAQAASPSPDEQAAVRKGFRAMYSCMVTNSPKEASDFVLYSRGGRGGRGGLFRETCRDEGGKAIARVQAVGDSVRYGLADALIAREFRSSYPTDIAARPPLKHEERTFDEAAFRVSGRFKALGPKGLAQAKAELATANFLSRFGECAVRGNPAAAHDFLVTEPATPAERAAFAKVRPVLGTCIKEGQQFGVSLDQVRGAMALNFYRLAKGDK